jgi:hypothetical protein
VSGTRTAHRGVLSFEGAAGGPLRVEFDSLRPVYLGLGTGYGQDADWRHGMYQGPLKVETRTFDLSDPAVVARGGLVDAVARFEYEGHVGYGLWEYAVVGPHQRYGFEGWADGYGTARSSSSPREDG